MFHSYGQSEVKPPSVFTPFNLTEEEKEYQERFDKKGGELPFSASSKKSTYLSDGDAIDLSSNFQKHPYGCQLGR
ncbi:hypothetical protein TNCV_62751 [Trichonephila clavipes]|nr:hypothetical protein TNCV_62751 [Trichonephila clavipes]